MCSRVYFWYLISYQTKLPSRRKKRRVLLHSSRSWTRITSIVTSCLKALIVNWAGHPGFNLSGSEDDYPRTKDEQECLFQSLSFYSHFYIPIVIPTFPFPFSFPLVIICPIAMAYSVEHIIKLVYVCQSVSMFTCQHSHGHISWSILTKIGTDVRSPKRKKVLSHHPFQHSPPKKNSHLRPRCRENPLQMYCYCHSVNYLICIK